MSKNIPITVKGGKTLPLIELKFFQGNLKELKKPEYEQLKKSIIKFGFTFPVFVWGSKILDGSQRIFVVNKMVRDEGYTINAIPIVEIEARDKKEAAQKIILINSAYGKITGQGLYEFNEEMGAEVEKMQELINLSDVDIKKFTEEYYNDIPEGKGVDVKIPGVDYPCPTCGHKEKAKIA